MMRNLRTAAFTGLLAVAGLVATADRADAQMYYSYYPGTSYYYNVTPYGGYQTYYAPGTSYSYASPYSNWNYTTPGYTYSSYYNTPYTSNYTTPYTGYSTMPYTAWNGSGWGYSPYNSYNTGYNSYYSNPVYDAVNTYRAVRGIIRR